MIPKVIYLQIGEDVDLDNFNDWDTGDVTWCRDKINDNDIKYILAPDKPKSVAQYLVCKKHNQQDCELCSVMEL